MRGIDSFDRSLINAVQKRNSCVPKISVLAKQLGKPRTTIFQRLKRLEKEGIILTYHGKIALQKVGKPLTVWMLIALASKQDFEKIGQELTKIPGVMEVHYVSGIYDFLVKVKVSDTDEYYNFSTKYIQQISGAVRTEGFITTKIFKEADFILV
ncbi:Lrp/AsnC family transcriptional regulator [archaeon]|nr:Lrp/AsnC family transcriptional regulator [archaeon]